MQPIQTINDWVKYTNKDAEVLWSVARAVLGGSVAELWNRKIDAKELELLSQGLVRYLSDEPLTRIRGWTEFCGLQFKVNKHVLDPRPETEMLVDYARTLKFNSVLDLGTGSGCIICSILHNTAVCGVGVDISPNALDVARYNAQNLGVEANFLLSNWCSNVDGRFDLVVSNPPYIKRYDTLPKDVWAYDPQLALDGGVSGHDAHRAALSSVPGVLNSGGVVLWEVGYDQGDWIKKYAQQLFPGARIFVHNDYNDLPRMLVVKT
jgi:release factor glutamine methyltransferase